MNTEYTNGTSEVGAAIVNIYIEASVFKNLSDYTRDIFLPYVKLQVDR